jgi:polyhydroxyalkanoate synthase
MNSDPLFEALRAARHAVAGCSPKDVVWRSGKLTLHRYRPLASARQRPDVRRAPLLIVYALVNRPYMMDLQEDRSLIRGLLAAGEDVYLVDWGYPDGSDRYTTLADYVDGHLDGCVRWILAALGVASLNLLGVCQGGVLCLCYAALYPTKIRNLITMVTPVDFHTSKDLLSKWVKRIDVGALVSQGNVAGETLNHVFLALMPFRLMQQKYVDLVSGGAEPARIENFMRLEQWIFDSPDQAAAAFGEFVRWCYQENRLVKNQLELGGRHVDLRALTVPVLNLIGKRDHLVPPESSAALRYAIGSKDYTALEFELGHIGMYVSSRAQREVPAAIAGWLAAR